MTAIEDTAAPSDGGDILDDACRTWPRLYLDTAELLDISDGRTPKSTVDDLLDAVKDAKAILVVSIEHMQDVFLGAPREALERLAEAADLFPLPAVVTKDPTEVEPWITSPSDISIRVVTKIREIVDDPKASPFLGKLSINQDLLHEAALDMRTALREGGRLSGQREKRALQCLVTLIRGWEGTDIGQILESWENHDGIELTEADRNHVLAYLEPWARLFDRVGSIVQFTEEQRGQLLATFRDSFDAKSHLHAPGTFLGQRLAGCSSRNTARNPLRSDSVDRGHATYFPYVDVATCDRGTYSCLAPHINEVKGTRTVRLFRNGHLQSVAEALRIIARASQDRL